MPKMLKKIFTLCFQ